jgi:hypothetical protein
MIQQQEKTVDNNVEQVKWKDQQEDKDTFDGKKPQALSGERKAPGKQVKE